MRPIIEHQDQPVVIELLPVDYYGSDSDRPAPCADCRRETQPRLSDGSPDFDRFDFYIVRAAVWAEAGMDGWASGFLCSPDLRRRIRRRLIADDFLARVVAGRPGRLTQEVTKEYLDWVLAGSPVGRMP